MKKSLNSSILLRHFLKSNLLCVFPFQMRIRSSGWKVGNLLSKLFSWYNLRSNWVVKNLMMFRINKSKLLDLYLIRIEKWKYFDDCQYSIDHNNNQVQAVHVEKCVSVADMIELGCLWVTTIALFALIVQLTFIVLDWQKQQFKHTLSYTKVYKSKCNLLVLS